MDTLKMKNNTWKTWYSSWPYFALKEINKIYSLHRRFLSYKEIQDISQIGNAYKMYSLIYHGHKSRAYQKYLMLNRDSARKMPDWVLKYFRGYL